LKVATFWPPFLFSADEAMKQPSPLILASASPRRAELLKKQGFTFEVRPSAYDEPPPLEKQDLRHYVAQLAFNKAWDVAGNVTGGWILAADTTGDLDGLVLNKPVDRADAERMIRLQEGREVAIHTGLCLMHAGSGKWHGFVDTSVLYMRPLTDTERLAYLDSGLWQGKAGAYGVQDDDPIVSVVSGSWSNIVGLPIEKLIALFEELDQIS
jgi:septum formation protein